jgi:hypothetical protein
MSDHTNTYPDLVNVEDWLNAKGYTGEAGACHQAMSLIRKQEKRIAALEAALREAYEVYAGSDGFIAETAAEGYLQQLISEMVAIIGAALERKNESL